MPSLAASGVTVEYRPVSRSRLAAVGTAAQPLMDAMAACVSGEGTAARCDIVCLPLKTPDRTEQTCIRMV